MTASTSVPHENGRGNGALPYAEVLDAIGFYVERAHGEDVLVYEIAGGFLVVFVTAAEQQVVTFDSGDLAQVRTEIEALEHSSVRSQEKSPRWGPLGVIRANKDTGPSAPIPGSLVSGDRSHLRTRLRAVGRYFDGRHTTAIMVQERADGYEVESTSQPVYDDLAPPSRVTELLDDQHLQTLVKQR